MAQALTFYSWRRSTVFDQATSSAPNARGRLTGSITLTLTNTEDPNEPPGSAATSFEIIGPGDVEGFQAAAVRGTMPPPGGLGAEPTLSAHVDLAAEDLPWRYTPAKASGDVLRPWIVLVVGTPSEVVLKANNLVDLAASVLQAHPLEQSARWAHVQDDGAHRVARLLSPRPLQARAEYVAAVVPAYDAAGAPRWSASTTGGLQDVPSYHSWTFTTGEADFATIAERLRPASSAGFGAAPLTYPPTGDPLRIRGALTAIGSSDPALPTPVATDLAGLRTQGTDAKGRPIVGLPLYGAPWNDDPRATAWGGPLNDDPRHRGAAGLGVWAGIELQQEVADAATEQLGALEIAAQRVRHVALGAEATRRLWSNRLPSDSAHRLQVFGPALRRIVTASGSVHDRITADGRPLPAGFFSTAARRVLRTGPARTALAKANALTPSALLTAANTCPPLPERAPQGLPHTDLPLKELDRWLREGVRAQSINREGLMGLLNRFPIPDERPDVDATDGIRRRPPRRNPLAAALQQAFDEVRTQVAAGAGLPVFALLQLLDPVPPADGAATPLAERLTRFDATPDEASVLDLARGLLTKPPERPCAPVDLEALDKHLVGVLDPHVPLPFAASRVLGMFSGLQGPPLAPPEICLDLDIPAWRFLRDHGPNWLLPGGGSVGPDSVIAVETNPVFVDAFLAGLNQQVLGELRFRNYALSSRCTPARVFWGRANAALDTAVDDIGAIEGWPDSALGDDDHRPADAAGTDLVLVFRTELFHRYPSTLVYVAPAPTQQDGSPDWSQAPDLSSPLFPTFQGTFAGDVAFFGFDLDAASAAGYWIVLEQPPAGYRFRNVVNDAWPPIRKTAFANATNGGDYAAAAFDDPTRVVIQGDALVPHVTP
jgi:hypothetical protein